jgi:hypothetical protein
VLYQWEWPRGPVETLSGEGSPLNSSVDRKSEELKNERSSFPIISQERPSGCTSQCEMLIRGLLLSGALERSSVIREEIEQFSNWYQWTIGSYCT